MPDDTYLPNYYQLVAALTDLHDKPCPFEDATARRKFLENEVILALGASDVWPAEILGEAA